MAEAMVQLAHANDHLQLIAESCWKTPSTHPDPEPAHAALLIRELYTELLRTDEVAARPDDFRAWLEDSRAAAEELESGLNNRGVTAAAGDSPALFSKLTNRITANCKACHVKYRDDPTQSTNAP